MFLTVDIHLSFEQKWGGSYAYRHDSQPEQQQAQPRQDLEVEGYPHAIFVAQLRAVGCHTGWVLQLVLMFVCNSLRATVSTTIKPGQSLFKICMGCLERPHMHQLHVACTRQLHLLSYLLQAFLGLMGQLFLGPATHMYQMPSKHVLYPQHSSML